MKVPSTDDPDRAKLYADIQMLMAGHSSILVMAVLADSLASVSGFLADDIDHAETILDTLAGDMKTTMRTNWAYLREVRVQAEAIGGKANA